MKRLGQVLGGFLAVALMAFSLQAVAETQLGGRDFNHMTTGFPLTGGHAVAACETCHTGGVFKGTPRNCDGCHATGKRIVATPKSTSHIVTDAPCESCHFNSATWLGARYNHGTAKLHQCETCHNGRISTAKPASHNTGRKMAESCDNCHRTFAWFPVSWNHSDTASDCSKSGCHSATDTVHESPGHLTLSMPPVSFIGSCKSCHTNYVSFYTHYYNHVGAPTTCQTCHGNLNGTGGYTGVRKPSSTIHTAVPVQTLTCNACHKSFGVWTGKYDHVGATACSTCHDVARTYQSFGIKGMPASHLNFSLYNPATTQCSVCHGTTSWRVTIPGTTLHTYLVTPITTGTHTPTCRSCHGGSGHTNKDGDDGIKDCSSNGCHKPTGGRGSVYQNWD